MTEPFSLRDQLFNRDTVGQLAREYAAALPGFDAAGFQAEALAGLAPRGLLERLAWLADCLEGRLAQDFPTLADQLEAAMPPVLDPDQADDDFGQFIHALPGVLAVRHGMDAAHRDRALDLIYAATKRFSMEFYIRPFLNRWPEAALARLAVWAQDGNYHVRRLVSEGTRPKLPWAKAVTLTPDQTLPLLDILHADPARYVTRSVANHLNDIAKKHPDLVLARLEVWRKQGRQSPKELAWMTRHALRTLIKQGHPGALALLGYRADAAVAVTLRVLSPQVAVGAQLRFEVELRAGADTPVLVDYRIGFARPNGAAAEKVFKLKQALVKGGTPLQIAKAHRMKGDATTYRLHAGTHRLVVQVNGVDRADATFDLG